MRLRADVLVDEHDGAVEQLAARRDQPGGELRAADVDRQDHRWQPLRRRPVGAVASGSVGSVGGCVVAVVVGVFVRIQTISREG